MAGTQPNVKHVALTKMLGLNEHFGKVEDMDLVWDLDLQEDAGEYCRDMTILELIEEARDRVDEMALNIENTTGEPSFWTNVSHYLDAAHHWVQEAEDA